MSDKSGRSLEQLVGRIQQMLDPNCEVSYREWIPDRLGNCREFDVVIRGHFAGYPMLGVIECKDWKRKVGSPEIDAFITKSINVHANFRIIVSRKGFAKRALEQARDAGVSVLSLLPNDPIEAGFSIGGFWYGRVYLWINCQWVLHFDGLTPSVSSYNGEEVLYHNKPVVNYFLKELSTTYGELKDLGFHTLTNKFPIPNSN